MVIGRRAEQSARETSTEVDGGGPGARDGVCKVDTDMFRIVGPKNKCDTLYSVRQIHFSTYPAHKYPYTSARFNIHAYLRRRHSVRLRHKPKVLPDARRSAHKFNVYRDGHDRCHWRLLVRDRKKDHTNPKRWQGHSAKAVSLRPSFTGPTISPRSNRQRWCPHYRIDFKF